MNRFKKDTHALDKIGFLIFIILLVVIARGYERVDARRW